MSEIESRLYDKFNINITDVKVLLADSGRMYSLLKHLIAELHESC